jgi:hypothetical protein
VPRDDFAAFIFGYLTNFDVATVYYEQKNDEETLTLTRWSPEQRRRRLQLDE